MNAKEAAEIAEIAEIAKVRTRHEYTTIIKIIKAHVNWGYREIELPQSLVTKGVFKELEKNGYKCSYSLRDCKISW